MENKLINFSVIGDARGNLVSIEALKNIPFSIKRVYYLYDLQKEIPRGFHSHKELQQVLVCVKGSCTIILDNGKERVSYKLNQPNIGLFVDRMFWREMHDFSSDCVLLVIASEYYSENDYIRDYQEFLK